MTSATSVAALPGATYFRLILDGLTLRSQGYEARRREVLALSAEGLSPPAIARELTRRAQAAGLTADEICRVGISEHNVRVMLRG